MADKQLLTIITKGEQYPFITVMEDDDIDREITKNVIDDFVRLQAITPLDKPVKIALKRIDVIGYFLGPVPPRPPKQETSSLAIPPGARVRPR